MVTIVGKDPQAVHRITCSKCASILEYTKSEVQYIHGKDYSGGPDGKQFIICPQCTNQVVIRSW